MAQPVTGPFALIQRVPATYLGAVQGVAALEQRIAEMQSWPGDFTSEIAAAHAFLMSIRTVFDIHPMSEAELDAAHEASVAELDALIAAAGRGNTDDVLAFIVLLRAYAREEIAS